MAGALRLGSNHYATLGLRPDATAAEIERAFRNELHPFMPHVVGGVAAASVAYATLRDPDKRRAYDQAHGFAPPPPPPPVAAPRPLVVTGGSGQMGNSSALRTMPPLTAEALRTPELEQPTTKDLPQPQAAPAAPVAAPQAQTRPERTAPPFLLAPDGPRPAPVILGMDEAEDLAIGGRKGMAALGAIAAVALAGGMLGWVAGSDADEVQAATTEAALPKAQPQDLTIITPVPAAADEPPVLAPTPVRRRPSPRAAPRATDVPPPQLASVAEAPAESLVPASDSLAPQPETSSAMPLGNATIARTIDRIGYRCGSVSSTESAGGGVFTVTCSSGQRFRASPRAGRYRFKRL